MSARRLYRVTLVTEREAYVLAESPKGAQRYCDFTNVDETYERIDVNEERDPDAVGPYHMCWDEEAEQWLNADGVREVLSRGD